MLSLVLTRQANTPITRISTTTNISAAAAIPAFAAQLKSTVAPTNTNNINSAATHIFENLPDNRLAKISYCFRIVQPNAITANNPDIGTYSEVTASRVMSKNAVLRAYP